MLAPETRGMSQPIETMWMKACDWLRGRKEKQRAPSIITRLNSGGQSCRWNSGPGKEGTTVRVANSSVEPHMIVWVLVFYVSRQQTPLTFPLNWHVVMQQKHWEVRTTNLWLNAQFGFSQQCYQCQCGVSDTQQWEKWPQRKLKCSKCIPLVERRVCGSQVSPQDPLHIQSSSQHHCILPWGLCRVESQRL